MMSDHGLIHDRGIRIIDAKPAGLIREKRA
jgi:hypothetical protein